MSRIERVGVIGAGVMGTGIAQLMAQSGLSVVLHDLAPGAAERARTAALEQIGRVEGKGRLPAGTAGRAAQAITVVGDVADMAGCDLVVEAVAERLDVKRDLFARLDAVVAADAVLATNTSALSVTAIAAGSRQPERVAGLHFFNPVPLMRVVEVVAGLRTAPAVADTLVDLCARVGHTAIRCADSPGFVINHIGRAYSTEALRLVQERVAEPQDIDAALRDGAGFRMGPFELFDLTGLDVSFAVMEEVYRGFYEEPRVRPTPLPRARVAAGLLGRKTGAGFYRYEDGRRVEPAEPAWDDARLRPIWAAPGSACDLTPLLQRLHDAGVPIDDGERPGPDSVLLTAPLGEDATSAALRFGLDPERTVAIDLMLPPVRRAMLMPTPATEPGALSATAAAMRRAGLAVTVLADGPGFVVQRVLAAIVNLACEAAQQELAVPADIDRAIELGLGYPCGPLAWGDRIGAGRVMTVLRALHELTGDPRYRPSPWLRRRATLGLPLGAPSRRTA